MKHRQPVSGQTLVADYQTAFVSAATVEAAKYEASRSENELVQQLEHISAGTYLNPGALAATDQDTLTRASLDAHIKKVQTQQLDTMNAQQLQALVAQDKDLYAGRKVTVTVRTSTEPPIDMVWFDQQNGYRTSVCKKKSVHGTIEEVLLDRNLLVVKPGWGLKLLNSRLQSYLVYVIDPESLQPMVELQVS